MSGFDGHVKLSLLNSPNNPEFPDRTARVRAYATFRHFVHSYIRTKFIKKNGMTDQILYRCLSNDTRYVVLVVFELGSSKLEEVASA